MINVTKPNLPTFEEYSHFLKSIWERNWLTNNGPLVNDLELRLKDYLNISHLLYLSNGTIAIQIALKALELETGSEIITTPFSYVATTSSIVWEGFTPVFVDIDKHTFNIDASKIESAITEKTSAILATHVFGNPCDVEAIDAIAKKYGLFVIYDAAHGFGTKYKGRSIYEYGDVSTTSFHATKLFHTIEGGAVVTKSPELLRKMSYLRNFGHNSPESFATVGINGKNSEFHAAMGLCNLKVIDYILKARVDACSLYDRKLKGSVLVKPKILANAEPNYSYYPVVFPSEEHLLKAISDLNQNSIFPRRYFYPSLNTLSYVKQGQMPVSEDVSKRILCLPLFFSISTEEIEFITRIVLRTLNN